MEYSEYVKSTRLEWLRNSARFTNCIQDMEAELKRMRDKKVSPEYIEKKDSQIQSLVEFYNDTDSLITSYRIAIANKHAEFMTINDCLIHALGHDMRQRVFARLINDIDGLKEKQELKKELIKKLNG